MAYFRGPDHVHLQVVEENRLRRSDRQSIGHMLSKAFNSGYRATAVVGAAPEFRVLARERHTGRVVGHLGMTRLHTSLGVPAYGISDVAVRHRALRRGVADRMVAHAHEEARRRGAKLIAAYTTALRHHLARRGYEPFAERMRGEDLPDYAQDAMAWHDPELVLPAVIHVDPVDF